MKFIHLVLIFSILAGTTPALAQSSEVTEESFNAIIDGLILRWQPGAKKQGVVLAATKLWDRDENYAVANRAGREWEIWVFGGAARQDYLTRDGLALLVCHEISHHFGGFPFSGPDPWASSEGQADYFAARTCLRDWWKKASAENAKSRATVDPLIQQRCDRAWRAPVNQDLCYRIIQAGMSFAAAVAFDAKGELPGYGSPNPRQVSFTDDGHPDPQCRLDTLIAGALNEPRPACWFKAPAF